MKILNFSLDQQLLKKDSSVANRLGRLAQAVQRIDFVVPSQKKTVFTLNNQAEVIGSGGITKLDRLFFLWRTGARLLAGRHYDLITVQDICWVGLGAVLLGEKFKKPVEVQVHGFEKMTQLKEVVTKLVLKKANGVRVVSERLKKQLIERFGVPAEKIYVIPITSPSLNRGEKRLLPNNQPPRLLAIGRLVPVKGFSLLLEAAYLLKQQAISFHLYIVGEGGEYHRLKKIINRLDLINEVSLEKPTADLTTYYREADLLVISSYQEGYSLVAVEAASFGLPIVMTDVGLAGEILIDNESAKVVSVGQKEALAEAIKTLLQDKDLAERLGQKAYEVAQKLPTEVDSLILYKDAWARLL